jgi:hypothetical protein
MKLATYTVEMKNPAPSAIPVGASHGQPFSSSFLPPAVRGDLSDPKEERMDQASAAPDSAAADGVWNYASYRTLDFSVIPPTPTLQRFHAWRFGDRCGWQRY